MGRENKKQYVSDFIKEKRDLFPYGIIGIWSGIDSGKNGLIEGYHPTEKERAEGKEDAPGLIETNRVLIITSRKAKVTETYERNIKDNPLLTDIRNLDKPNWDDLNDKSVIYTTAHISKRIYNDWHPLIENTYFWRKFDYIVIDEFHSLITA